jgi:hypothetical protein
VIGANCVTSEACLNSILDVITQPSKVDFTDWAPAAAAVLVSIAAVVVSVFVAGIEQKRVLRAERQALRQSLRLWFSGLSDSAEGDVRHGHRALDSRIKEDIGPLGRGEIRRLMEWARLVHDSTQAIEKLDKNRKDEMHARRMHSKWIFRDLLAEWALRPLRTRVKIWAVTRRGYSAVGTITIEDPKKFAESMRPFNPGR